MDFDGVDQRQTRIPQTIDMLERRFVVDESALQRRSQEPRRELRVAGFDVAKIHRQRRDHFLVTDLTTDDLEVDDQSFFVFDNLRLRRGDREILGQSLANVGGQQAQDVRLGGFHFFGKGVVANDVPLMEVVEFEQRVRMDGDRGWEQVDRNQLPVLDVLQSATDAINGRPIRRRIAGRDQRVFGNALPKWGNHTAPRHIRQARQLRSTNAEQIIRRISVFVSNVQNDSHV